MEVGRSAFSGSPVGALIAPVYWWNGVVSTMIKSQVGAVTRKCYKLSLCTCDKGVEVKVAC